MYPRRGFGPLDLAREIYNPTRTEVTIPKAIGPKLYVVLTA